MSDLVLGLYIRMRALACLLRIDSLLKNEDGQDMVEYALVLGLIAMGSVAAMQGLAASISTGLTSIGANLTASTS